MASILVRVRDELLRRAANRMQQVQRAATRLQNTLAGTQAGGTPQRGPTGGTTPTGPTVPVGRSVKRTIPASAAKPEFFERTEFVAERFASFRSAIPNGNVFGLSSAGILLASRVIPQAALLTVLVTLLEEATDLAIEQAEKRIEKVADEVSAEFERRRQLSAEEQLRFDTSFSRRATEQAGLEGDLAFEDEWFGGADYFQ